LALGGKCIEFESTEYRPTDVAASAATRIWTQAYTVHDIAQRSLPVPGYPLTLISDSV